MAKKYFLFHLTLSALTLVMAGTTFGGAQPTISIRRITQAAPYISLGSTTTAQYEITNNTKLTRTMTIKPINGVEQTAGSCANPFTLDAKQSCLLNLLITADNLGKGVHQGPVACKTQSPTDHSPSNFFCSQPSYNELLDVTVTNSICDSNKCTQTLSVLDADISTFNSNFTVVNGYHVGTQEYQEYLPQQVSFVGTNTTDPAYIKLIANPVADFSCIGRGYIDPYNRANVSTGTCTYQSGAFYSYRNGFYVNKDPQGRTIEHGGIELQLRIKKDNGALTMDQLYQKGAWPAVWLMSSYVDDTFRFNSETFTPKNLWPSAMEIDILELINGGWTATTPITGSIHYGYLANSIQTSWNYINNVGDYDRQILPLYPEAKSDAWHNYGITWQRQSFNNNGNAITQYILGWYYDGIKYTSITITRQINNVNGTKTYTAEREVNGAQQLIWCTSSSARCCTVESNRCNITLDVAMPLTEAEVMFASLTNGFDSGYYLNVNLAAGGDGIGVYDPGLPGFPPPSFGSAEMHISSIKRYTIL